MVLYPRHCLDTGPGIWHISNDLLDYMPCFTRLQAAIHEACESDQKSSLDTWTILKAQCKEIIQQFIKFHKKQTNVEAKSL